LSENKRGRRDEAELLTNATMLRSARLSVRFLMTFDGTRKAKLGKSWVDILLSGSVADEILRRMCKANRWDTFI
jgi:hypothetical protein